MSCVPSTLAWGFADRGGAAWAVAADWPQWLGPQRDGVRRETGLVEKFPEGGPKVLWRAPLGVGYAGPAVVGDRVYVMDFSGHSTKADSRCVPHAHRASPGSERVLCLRSSPTASRSGQHDYDCPYTISYPNGPRTTPLVDGGRVYTLGAMGDLLCLDAADGKVHWSKNLAKHLSDSSRRCGAMRRIR